MKRTASSSSSSSSDGGGGEKRRRQSPALPSSSLSLTSSSSSSSSSSSGLVGGPKHRPWKVMDHGVDDELICFEKGVLYKVRVLAKRVRKRKSEANDKRRLWYKVRFDGRNTRFDQWVLPHFLRPVAGFPVRRFFPKGWTAVSVGP